ncbi:hypothetical protein [Acidisphaera sp. L21]|uniref:hypothetical protein n=1 Tax=Acidisphaera sp. L21 TaxID=1641851 RepID=UPI00131E2350|nr:hypothetical protein [Acidisphaera sp. L21]
MLVWSACSLAGVVVLGVVAASTGLRYWAVGAAHGGLALVTFVLLLVGLRGPARGVEFGAGAFGRIAAVLVAITLLIGAGLLAARLRRRAPSPLVIGLHATLGVAALVMLAAYVSV